MKTEKKVSFEARAEDAEIFEADFETAVAATKFGKFNFLFLFIIIPTAFATITETTLMSYIFPIAQCDLDLTLDMKGSLNAITFSGMLISSPFWGYVADTLGRKKIMVYGLLAQSILIIATGFAQNYTVLMILKFFCGFIMNGPTTTFAPYLSEFQSLKYRSNIQLFLGMAYGVGMMLLPLIAMVVLPIDIHIHLFDDFVLHSWNVFIFLTGIPSVFCCVYFSMLPESPKFLMAVGRNEEALRVFKKMYRMNTGKSEETFKVKSLVDEIKLNENSKTVGKVTANRSTMLAIKEGLSQVKPLLHRPLRSKFLLMLVFYFFISMGNNSIRLWMPQMFSAITNYESQYKDPASSLCQIIEFVQPNITNIGGDINCIPNIEDNWTYLNSVIVALVITFAHIISACVINMVGKKKLVFVFTIIGACCGLGLYFSTNTALIITCSSLFVSSASAIMHITSMVAMDYFPTTLRAMTLYMILFTGRGGSLTGNMVFPLLLDVGCLPPFLMVTLLLFSCTVLTVFLPKTHLKALE